MKNMLKSLLILNVSLCGCATVYPESTCYSPPAPKVKIPMTLEEQEMIKTYLEVWR